MNHQELVTIVQEIKEFINFTWDEPAKEKRIMDYTISSMNYLNEVAGKELDFNSNSLARELLFNRVLYMDSHALNDFGYNYEGMLNELKIANINYENASI